MPPPLPGREHRLVTLPNLISLSRVVLTAAVAWAILARPGALALILFAVVVVSDLSDGFIARHTGQSSRFGMLLDHGADALFVVTVTCIYAWLGVFPLLLPVTIAFAFIQYVVDSHVFDGARLRPSALGRWNGIAYFFISGAAITLGYYRNNDPVMMAALSAGAWILIATTIGSIVQRFLHARAARTAA